MFNLDESAMLNSNTGAAAAAALDSIVRVCRRQARKSIDRNMVPYYHYVLHSRLLCRGYSWLTGWSGSAIGSLINGSSPPPQKVSLFLLPESASANFPLHSLFIIFSSPVFNIHAKSYQKMPHFASIDLADWRILHQTGAMWTRSLSITVKTNYLLNWKTTYAIIMKPLQKTNTTSLFKYFSFQICNTLLRYSILVT